MEGFQEGHQTMQARLNELMRAQARVEAAAVEGQRREQQIRREEQLRPLIDEFHEQMNPTCPTCHQAFEKDNPRDCIAIQPGQCGDRTRRCPEFCEICLEVNPCSGHRGAHAFFSPEEVRRGRLPVMQRRLERSWQRVPRDLREEFKARIALDVVQLGLRLPTYV